MGHLGKVLRDPKLLIVLLMGFSSGLPLLLVGATLGSWMTRAGVDLPTIGIYTSAAMLPYSWKFLWAPFMDRFSLKPFGRRRGWLVLTQLGLLVLLFAFSTIDPATQVRETLVLAMLTAFMSASQDIVIDAYRREILPDEELGLGSSLAVFGYRMGTMLASSGAFLLADHMAWSSVYAVMAVFMLIGLITTFFCPEPKIDLSPPMNLKEAVVGPLQEFFRRDGAWLIFAFVLLYKAGEAMANKMYNPLYIQIGFTNTEIGTVGKFFGVWSMIAGQMVGGVIMVQLKLYRSLWLFGILQTVCLLLFSALAHIGHSIPMLAAAVGGEYFTSGMASAAFVAFIATQSHRRFTAVQYALLSSLAVQPQFFLGSATGFLANAVGWQSFFIVCAFLTLPGLLMLIPLKRLIHHA